MGGAAVLYLFLGQLGLLVVGVAVGVVGHATLTTAHATAAVAIDDWLLQARSRGDAHSRGEGEDDGLDALRLKVRATTLLQYGAAQLIACSPAPRCR